MKQLILLFTGKIRKALFNILYNYVVKDCMKDTRSKDFKVGDIVKLNWKARIYFHNSHIITSTESGAITEIDSDIVNFFTPKTDVGTSGWASYWICKAKWYNI